MLIATDRHPEDGRNSDRSASAQQAGHEVARDFPPDPSAVPDARRWAVEVARQWGIEGDAVEVLAFDVTELASNAVRHARSPFRVKLARHEATLRVEVVDASSQPARVLKASPEATAGRGLALIQALNGRTGVDRTRSGKRVWVEFEI